MNTGTHDDEIQAWGRALPHPPPLPTGEGTVALSRSTLPPTDDRPTVHDPSCIPSEARAWYRRLAAWLRARLNLQSAPVPPPPAHSSPLDGALWCATSEELARVAQLVEHIRAVRAMGADEAEAQLVYVASVHLTPDAYGAVDVAQLHEKLRGLTPAAIDGTLARLSAAGRIDLFPDGRGGQRCRLRPTKRAHR